MVTCKNCGANFDEKAGVCPICGTVPRISTWDGGVLDTIVASIVASLITTFTCGIGAPWAICYMMKFVVEHAVIDGRRMKFDGNGGQLFGQWIKWFILCVITCGIYGFWVVPRLYKWVCSHIHVA